ncbi:hypothetical protein [Mesorhizobium sp.]|uniref:hypothetical protein n=1 Tax=Mesorhizobium sp. TaxID=1871066 RepID=UPI000FEA35A7|nr:hypothetical protein [Mesorhizobium sp.]RWA84500.1 MAG: hypothetical protein EOQ30_09360 [Mesorhizobium sp.]
MTLSDVEHGSSSALSASGIRAGYLDGFVPRLPVDLAGRSESEWNSMGLVEVVADKYIGIDAVQGNLAVAGAFEQASDIAIGHRERGRAAGVRAFSLRGRHCRTVRGSDTGAARWPWGLVACHRA